MIVPARQLVAKSLRIMSTLRFRVRALGVPLPVVRMAKASGSHNSHARAFRWWSALGGDKSAIWCGGSATGVLAPRGPPAPDALQCRVPDTYPAHRHSQHPTVPESVLTKVCAGGCLATYTKGAGRALTDHGVGGGGHPGRRGFTQALVPAVASSMYRTATVRTR
jgi:hypothetical protein